MANLIASVEELSSLSILKLQGKLNDSEAKSIIEQNSGTIVSGITKKLNYLIVGDKPTKRKIDTAKQLKVKILSQKEWLSMLDNTS